MKTKVILEMGCNHNGDIEIAKKMIDEAEKLGVWAVKFQKRDVEAIPEKIKNKPRDLVNSYGTTYYTHRKALEFSMDIIKELKEYSKKKGLVFACSVFDLNSYNQIKDIGVEYIKLPSQLLLDTSFHSKKCSRNHKIIVSTGMHDQEEILRSPWKQDADIVMHCISVYPCLSKNLNLNTIELLRYEWLSEVGYSSHDYHGHGIHAAVLCGAKYIERHFTLDNSMKGSDHSTVSSDPVEMAYIMERIKTAETMKGGKRELTQQEKMIRKTYRGF